MEQTILEIILNSGEARSLCLQAMSILKEHKYAEARALMIQAKKPLNLAHKAQTNIIQEEAAGHRTEVSLLMIHAQDHLMTTLSIRDIVEVMIDYAEQIGSELLKGKESNCND
ncbi:PTS system cellobiose-specific EIIA component [bioreactor metagenome]|uniref:PTS system cellobiose-specific EIIA component n=1 Tax=bioreactor metagenome TaxID=1076179 RepID=A0A645BXG7_9ZZZZ